MAQNASQQYAIEVAGIKVGKLTIEQATGPSGLVYNQVSNTEFWFFGKIRINYKTITRCNSANLLLQSTVDATTSRGTFKSEVVRRNDQYAVNVNQYKYTRQASIREPIDFVISRLYFDEPTGRKQVFSEYFGDFATVEPTGKGSYRVRINDREDEYFYEKGRLVKIVKKNPIKNFVIRRED